jgi:hypothetical protein
MLPDIELNYNSQIFDPPAPVVSVELRSPASPTNPAPVRLVALIDSGAFMSLIPWTLIGELHLQQVDYVMVGDYNAVKEEDLKTLPVYWVHLTIPPLKPIMARVAPKKPESHVTIGRDVINDWLLTLDGPKLRGLIKT